MTLEEFRKTIARMFRSVADPSFILDKKPCKGVHCVDCPIFEETNTTSDKCMINNLSIFDAFDIIEIVSNWAKEHPIVTYEQKYEETFGVKPINDSGEYICPSYLGFKPCKYLCGNGSPCVKCAKDFWQSEYKPPKKEGE